MWALYHAAHRLFSGNSNHHCRAKRARRPASLFLGVEISFAGKTNIICRGIASARQASGQHTDDALSFLQRHQGVGSVLIEFAALEHIDGVSDDWQTFP